jgi:hypothetical protein
MLELCEALDRLVKAFPNDGSLRDGLEALPQWVLKMHVEERVAR